MSLLFADTYYWIALTNPRDSAHRQVMEFTARLGPLSVITTDEVFTEFLAYCASDRQLRLQGGLAVRELLNDPDIRTIPQTRTDCRSTRPVPTRATCISMQIMRQERLTDVLTNDRHFEQEGFRALFRDS